MNKQEELIAMCRRGDAAAYTELYNEHSQAVYNTIIRLVKHDAEAEDVLQESFVAAFQRIDQFKVTGGFRAWVKRIAINKSVDLIRKRKINFVKMDTAQMPDIQEDTIDEAAFQYTMDAVADAIDALPDNYRTVFTLYAVENVPQAEIAQMLGLENTTVRTQYHRAKQKILVTLGKGGSHE
jgi:RNA polymerase sigma factor (sigma-70 family)